MADLSRLEDVKSIDEKTKYCVFGYIRRSQDMFPVDNIYFTIPTLVIHWILLYFHINEKFKVYNKQKYKLHDNDMAITKIDVTSDSTCYGTVKISSLNQSIHEWLFEITAMKNGEYIAIGIDETQYSRKDVGSINYEMYDTKIYALWNDGERRTCANVNLADVESLKFCEGDKVSMILNLFDQTLSYSINDGELYVTHKDIVVSQDITYCMAACIQNVDSTLTLLKYERKSKV